MQYNPAPMNYNVKPVRQVNFPTQYGYGYGTALRGRGRGRDGGRGQIGRGRGPRTPFADYVVMNSVQQFTPTYGGGAVVTSVLTAGTQQI